MENAAEILVIILSAVLAVFLVLSITLIVLLIKLTNTIRRIAEKADDVIDNVEAAANVFKNAAGPLAAGKFIVNLVEAVLSKKKGRK